MQPLVASQWRFFSSPSTNGMAFPPMSMALRPKSMTAWYLRIRSRPMRSCGGARSRHRDLVGSSKGKDVARAGGQAHGDTHARLVSKAASHLWAVRLLEHREAHVNGGVGSEAQRREMHPPDDARRPDTSRHAAEAAVDLVEEVALLRPLDAEDGHLCARVHERLQGHLRSKRISHDSALKGESRARSARAHARH